MIAGNRTIQSAIPEQIVAGLSSDITVADVGKLVYFNIADGKFSIHATDLDVTYLADTLPYLHLGILKNIVSESPLKGTIVVHGYAPKAGAVIGERYYIQDTGGQIGLTIPTNERVLIGTCYSANYIYVDVHFVDRIGTGGGTPTPNPETGRVDTFGSDNTWGAGTGATVAFGTDTNWGADSSIQWTTSYGTDNNWGALA